MKNFFLLILLSFLLLSASNYAQILNSSFENWTQGQPDNWATNNVPTFFVGVTQSNESHSGSSAAKLEIKEFAGGVAFPILFSTGDPGFTVSQAYASLKGFYKFLPTNATQVFSVTASMYNQSNIIGIGNFSATTTANIYTEFDCPIDYFSADIPDAVYIQIILGDENNIFNGGAAYVDDLSLSGTVDVKEIEQDKTPTSYKLMQNYPNPFNPTTKIEYLIPKESFVTLKVYNLIGQEIATLVNKHQKAGTYEADFNAEGLQSGIYVARLSADNFTQSVKMTLLK
jgi:hypothetical protein